MTRTVPSLALAAALLLGLSACGVSPTDRMLSGGAIGAGAGAAGGAIFGSPLTGAALGAAVGAAAGGLTDDSQVYLGEPVWNRNW